MQSRATTPGQVGFKKVEAVMQHPVVPALLLATVEAGDAGAGLNSFGPTVYAVGDSGMAAVARAATETPGECGGSVILTWAGSCGANVRAG